MKGMQPGLDSMRLSERRKPLITTPQPKTSAHPTVPMTAGPALFLDVHSLFIGLNASFSEHHRGR